MFSVPNIYTHIFSLKFTARDFSSARSLINYDIRVKTCYLFLFLNKNKRRHKRLRAYVKELNKSQETKMSSYIGFKE